MENNKKNFIENMFWDRQKYLRIKKKYPYSNNILAGIFTSLTALLAYGFFYENKIRKRIPFLFQGFFIFLTFKFFKNSLIEGKLFKLKNNNKTTSNNKNIK